MCATRMLLPFEFDKYRDHLVSLGAEDRRLRFGALVDDGQIVHFADGINPRETAVLAQLGPDLEVVAAVQMSIIPGRAVELAFSVDSHLRHNGIGTALMTRALLWARNRGFSKAYVTCRAENIAMRRLARKAGMVMTTAGGEMEGVMDLPAATLLSVVAEVFGEGIGLADLVAKSNRRARARLRPSPILRPFRQALAK